MSSEAPGFKDLFSKQSTDYAKFRPLYPAELYDYLAGLVAERKLAWDCGTGNGQAAVELASRFERVLATDPSQKQIQSAEPRANIVYSVASAESSGLPSASAGQGVDLVTVAQALHWFKHDEFSREVKRVVRPGGVLAVWSYGLMEISPEVDFQVLHFYRDLLGPYWEPERRLVEEGYKSVRIPFEELKTPAFFMKADWTFEHLIGYLRTWSALQTCIVKTGEDPLEKMALRLKAAWGRETHRPVIWPLSVRVFRIGS